jgi:hypothetical protein
MYEVLSGHMPFDGETLHAVVINASTQPHVALQERAPRLDRRVCALVEACLSKDPGRRPADAGVLLVGLEALLREPDVQAQLRVPVKRSAPGEAPTTREHMPFADTAISSIPLRLRDSPLPPAPKKKRPPLLVLGLSALALVLVLIGFLWLLERGETSAKGTEASVPAQPTAASGAAAAGSAAKAAAPAASKDTSGATGPARHPGAAKIDGVAVRPMRPQPSAAEGTEPAAQAKPARAKTEMPGIPAPLANPVTAALPPPPVPFAPPDPSAPPSVDPTGNPTTPEGAATAPAATEPPVVSPTGEHHDDPNNDEPALPPPDPPDPSSEAP